MAAALAAALPMLEATADQAAGQEETQQAQAALETRPLLVQVKETMVDQRQAVPAAVEEAVQVP